LIASSSMTNTSHSAGELPLIDGDMPNSPRTGSQKIPTYLADSLSSLAVAFREK
jgi:hypothetical protein